MKRSATLEHDRPRKRVAIDPRIRGFTNPVATMVTVWNSFPARGEQHITRGGYGFIFDVPDDRNAVRKRFILKGDCRTISRMRRSLHREILASRLFPGHPNIIHIDKILVHKDFKVVDLQMVRGEHSLADKKWQASATHAERLAAIYQIFRALKAIHGHQKRVIHSDIRTCNLVLIPHDPPLVILIDFGICAFSAGNEARQVWNSMRGQPPGELRGFAHRQCSPPEVFDTKTPYGRPVDIWMAGLAAAEIMWGGAAVKVDARKFVPRLWRDGHFNAQYLTSLFNAGSAVDRSFLDFIEGCLQLDPQKRFSAGKALSHALFKPIRREVENAFPIPQPTEMASSELDPRYYQSRCDLLRRLLAGVEISGDGEVEALVVTAQNLLLKPIDPLLPAALLKGLIGVFDREKRSMLTPLISTWYDEQETGRLENLLISALPSIMYSASNPASVLLDLVYKQVDLDSSSSAILRECCLHLLVAVTLLGDSGPVLLHEPTWIARDIFAISARLCGVAKAVGQSTGMDAPLLRKLVRGIFLEQSVVTGIKVSRQLKEKAFEYLMCQ